MKPSEVKVTIRLSLNEEMEEVLHCRNQEAVVAYSGATVCHFQSRVKHYHQSKISPVRRRISIKLMEA